jgi:hypothetical protein
MNSIISFCKNIVFFSVLIIFGFSVFSNPVYSQTQNWTFVNLNANLSVAAYIDKNIKKLPNGNLQVWQKLLFNDGFKNISLINWDCQRNRSQTIQQTILNDLGGVVKISTKIENWMYSSPGSVSEDIQKMVCRGNSDRKKVSSTKTKTKISLAEITTTAASLRESPSINGSLIREVQFGEQLILANEEPSGNWHKVIDKETQSEGWLHNTTFKIIKPGKSSAKKAASKKKRK